jgi:saccharopine dehydrogenase (NAD+, L-glutamate forming)
VVAGLGLAAQVKPARDLLMRWLPAGKGPDEAKRETSWFTVDFVGEAGGETVHTRVTGGDPGYTETAMMVAESALCLALDDNPAVAGQVTTAQAMGANLLARVQAGGLRFEVRS